MFPFFDITESEIKELELMAEKSPALAKVLDFLSDIETDALKNSYITYNQKLIELNASVKSARFDINDKEDKGFDRISKLMLDTSKIALSLSELKKSFTPEEQLQIDNVQRRGGAMSNWSVRRKKKGKE